MSERNEQIVCEGILVRVTSGRTWHIRILNIENTMKVYLVKTGGRNRKKTERESERERGGHITKNKRLKNTHVRDVEEENVDGHITFIYM